MRGDMHARENSNAGTVIMIIIMHRGHFALPFSCEVSRATSDLSSKRTKEVPSFKRNLQRHRDSKATRFVPYFPVDRGGLSVRWQRLEAKLAMACKSKLLSEADTAPLCRPLP
jgi:hypothetical protein